MARFLAVLVMPAAGLAAMAGLAPTASAAAVSPGSAVAPAVPAVRLAAAPAALQAAIRESLGIPAFAEGYSQRAELTASDAAAGDVFGASVALSAQGTTALVGAPFQNPGAGEEAGAAYVFTLRYGTWTQTAELTNSDAAKFDQFGTSVALSAEGTTALVGAPGAANSGKGAAYVFRLRFGTWTQTAELTASDAAADDVFGASVALSAPGTTALVGANEIGVGAGAAYVFTLRFGTWTQTAELTASDAAKGDQFGTSVALSAHGTTALVGALGHNSAAGRAYVFTLRFGTWSQTAELTASDAAANDQFGFSVALSAQGSEVLVGAPNHNSDTGAAYVFTLRFRTWSQTAELTASDAAAGDFFGSSVALSAQGGTALVGALGSDSVAGSAYVFTLRFRTWSQAAELTASDAAAGDQFGFSVALSAWGSTALVGAAEPYSAAAGAAYVFTREGFI